MENNYMEMERENNRIQDECVTLQEENRKRWKKTGMLCGVFLALAVVINVGTYFYFGNKTQRIEHDLEQEYSAKRNAVLEWVEEEQH